MSSNTSSLPTYTDVNNALNMIDTGYSAAQAHGLMCGLMCTDSKQNQHWQSLLMGDDQNPDVQQVLQELYEMTEHQLAEFSFEFSLLLPDESRDINERTEALGLWCQGFLVGLEKNGVPLKNREPSDITEAIDDLLNISEVSFGDIVEDEEDETAYFELVEYVRLAVLMIYHELSLKSSREIKKEDGLLH